jgi:hypothetical protein
MRIAASVCQQADFRLPDFQRTRDNRQYATTDNR